jgi:hypothetical protein
MANNHLDTPSSVIAAIDAARARWSRVEAAQAARVKNLEPRLRRQIAQLRGSSGVNLEAFGFVKRRPGESALGMVVRRALTERDPVLAELAAIELFFLVQRAVRAELGRSRRGDAALLTAKKMFELARQNLAGERVEDVHTSNLEAV